MWLVLGTLLATAMVVSSANALNCWMERDIDRHMTRTKDRPLPAGRLDPRVALVWGVALGAVSVPLLAIFANPMTAFLGAVALLSYVGIYTPLKQRSWTALLIGSVPGALPPLMGWTAITGQIEAPGVVLFGILFLWQLPHFIAISLFRQGEYTRAGFKVLPAVLGRHSAKVHAVLWAAALVPVSLALVPLGIAGWLYLSVAGLAGLWFFARALQGLRESVAGDKLAEHQWSRQLFFASLAYLPVVFAALAVDVTGGF
jgi:protoheme IX farnesyltransferase